ncbi:MAG TPA: hypothetical protein V6D11_23230 [Waterburya sp.]|jgi:hypothetical protein
MAKRPSVYSDLNERPRFWILDQAGEIQQILIPKTAGGNLKSKI